MIEIKDIKVILSGEKLELIDSYDFHGKHRLKVRSSIDNSRLPAAIPIMGIKFIHIHDGMIEIHGEKPSFAHIYECVFSNEVLENSLKLTFETTK